MQRAQAYCSALVFAFGLLGTVDAASQTTAPMTMYGWRGHPLCRCSVANRALRQGCHLASDRGVVPAATIDP